MIRNGNSNALDQWSAIKWRLRQPGFYEGFRDALNGSPPDREFLDGDQRASLDYESGRQWAVEFMSRGKRPRWTNRRRIPPTIKAAFCSSIAAGEAA